MTEVFMLGALVTMTKLANVAEAIPGLGFWAIGAMMLLLTAGAASFDPHDLWERVTEIEHANRLTSAGGVEAAYDR
jgi:paraquat-inducible protein A